MNDRLSRRKTILGGTQRLRGYRTNRFYDSYTNFLGIEYRWYLIETQDNFNYFVERGVFRATGAAELSVGDEFSVSTVCVAEVDLHPVVQSLRIFSPGHGAHR